MKKALRTVALSTLLVCTPTFAEPVVDAGTPDTPHIKVDPEGAKPISPYLLNAYRVCPDAPKMELLPNGNYSATPARIDRLACKQTVCEMYVKHVEADLDKPDSPMVAKIVAVVAAGLVVGFAAGYAVATVKK